MDGKNPPIGKNVLRLTNIQRSENYTCQAASKLALIENTTQVRVQGKKYTLLFTHIREPHICPQHFSIK